MRSALGWVFLGALGLLLAAALLLRGRADPERTAPSPPPAASHRHEIPPTPAAPAAPLPERAPGRQVRVRRADGRVELADEEELRAHAGRARKEFDAARVAFHAAFARKEAVAGVEAAVQVLEAALGRPLADLASRAQAYEAAFLLVALHGEPRAYAPFVPAMAARIRSTLLDAAADPELQRVLLAALSGVGHQFHFEARSFRAEDGGWVSDLGAPADVALLTDAPPLTPGPGPRTSPGAPALADTLWTVARNLAAPPLARAGALLALGGAGGPREVLLELSADEDSDVRRGAVYLLTLRPEPLAPGEFLAVLDAQRDPISRSLAIRGLATPVAGDPGVRDALLARVTAPAGGVTVPQLAERRAALSALLADFAGRRDPGTLAALAPHVDRWAGEVWKSTSPLVLLAEEAARLKLKELLPYLRAAAPRVPDADDRRRVEEAVGTLGP